MRFIRCQKCGAAVISEETFLENILDAMDEARCNARRAKSRMDANAYLAEAAKYKTIYKAFMHHLTERDRAEHNADSFKVKALYDALVRTGRISEADFDTACKAGEAKAAAKRVSEDKELNAIYGSYETSCCNRTKASPTERAAIRNCMRGERP